MAGHSHASNVKHKKDLMDTRKAKAFTKIARELTISARQDGTDPEFNPRLKSLLEYAKYLNFPKDNIQRALQKSQCASDQEMIIYECFAGTIPLIITAYTNNKKRLAPQIRAALKPLNGDFSKCMYMFSKIIRAQYYNTQDMLDKLLACDLLNIQTIENDTIVSVDFDPKLSDIIEQTVGISLSKEETYQSLETITITTNHPIHEILLTLETNEDIVDIFHNLKL